MTTRPRFRGRTKLFSSQLTFEQRIPWRVVGTFLSTTLPRINSVRRPSSGRSRYCSAVSSVSVAVDIKRFPSTELPDAPARRLHRIPETSRPRHAALEHPKTQALSPCLAHYLHLNNCY